MVPGGAAKVLVAARCGGPLDLESQRLAATSDSCSWATDPICLWHDTKCEWIALLISPRLTDFYGILKPQAELAFAIPHFNEDIPLYVDPFLLWASPSQPDQMAHTGIINAFNHLGYTYTKGNPEAAIDALIRASECDEVGLGGSAKRKGKRIGRAKAVEILELFKRIPQYQTNGFRHFEEIQFFVDGISKDRISDIACNFLKSFLIDFTIQECERLGIPRKGAKISDLYDYRSHAFVTVEGIELPFNPESGEPLILVPMNSP